MVCRKLHNERSRITGKHLGFLQDDTGADDCCDTNKVCTRCNPRSSAKDSACEQGDNRKLSSTRDKGCGHDGHTTVTLVLDGSGSHDTRNTLDLSAVPIIHEKTHLPIVVDPSHATGKANLVEPMMIAAVAAGADGLEVEVHYDPQHAWSDGAQCLTPDAFAQAMAKCRQVAWAIGREM